MGILDGIISTVGGWLGLDDVGLSGFDREDAWSMPSFDLPDFNLDWEMPDIKMPDFNVDWPDFNFDWSGLGESLKSVLSAVQPWAPSLTGAASAYGSYEAQKLANETNIALTRENNAFNADQARINREFQDAQAQRQMGFQYDWGRMSQDWTAGQAKRQMDFQERMANTAYQRAVQDIQAAGLNPMLAYMHGGAPSPAGASGSSSGLSGASGSGSLARGTPARVENALAVGINSANQSARVAQDIQMAQAQIENVRKVGARTEAETDLIRANIPKVYQDTQTSAASAGELRARTDRIGHEIDQIWHNIAKLMAEKNKIYSENERVRFEVEKLQPEFLRLARAQASLAELEIPAARNMATAQGSWWMREVSPFLPDFLRGATGLQRGRSGLGLRTR